MAITIEQIESKEFKMKPSGYDPEEVDSFLDAIMDEFEDMQRRIQQLKQEARQQKQHTPSAAAHPDTSEAAQKLLANAQRVSDETMADARRQAEMILSEAKARADSTVDEAKREAKRLTDSLNDMRSAASDYRARFKQLVDEQMRIIDAEDELFE